MTTYFISPDGNNSNNGLGPDASHASNKPWLTLGKAMNTGSPVVPGDTVWVAPGYYYATLAIPIAGITSSASPTVFQGDPTNSQGFKTAGGVLLAPGLSWFTTRTSGEGIDGIIASSGIVITGVTHNPKGLVLRHLEFENSPSAGDKWLALSTDCTDWVIEDCRWNGRNGIGLASGTPKLMNLTVRRCSGIGRAFMDISLSGAPATADLDMNILIERCLMLTTLQGVGLALSGSGGNLAGGVRIKGCTSFGEAFIVATALRISTVTPVTLEGCLTIGGRHVAGGTAGQVISSGHNRFYAHTAATNFTEAGTDVLRPLLNIVLPDLVTMGLEMPRADFLGWTGAAAATQKDSAWAPTTPDFRGRTVAPWGAGAAIGYIEAPTIAQDAASAITGGGANSLKMTGAGEVSFFLPVTAASTVVSIRTKSSSYGGSNYPQIIVQPNPSIGVAGTTATATDASEQDVATASFTPTAAGVVEVRLVSRSSSVSSETWFDSLAVTP